MLSGDERAVLQFSGGADSTALLWMARPWLSQIKVIFADPGSTFPHVVEHIEATCLTLGADLQIVRPAENVLDYTIRVGLPSDIVPIETMAEMVPMLREKPRQLLQSYLKCCGAMIWEPMQRAVKASGTKIVLRGSKKSDSHVGVPDGFVEDGITYRSPLWLMSDEDVAEYLKREGVALPEHYAMGIRSSLDCTCCTAFLAHHGAAKMRWTKEHYPDLWPELARRMNLVRGAVDGERAKIVGAFDVARLS